MARLRDETAEHHARAESKPLEQALIAGELERSGYVRYLQQRYLIHAALEQEVAKLRDGHAPLSNVVRDELFQTGNLRRDLEFLGADGDGRVPLAATRKLLDEIERLATAEPLALLGIYYVFEGSKNGARIIAKRIARAHDLTPGPGLLYLDPHGEEQRPLWLALKGGMDACDFSPADQDAMVAAAQFTFDRIAELDDEIYAGCAAGAGRG